MHCCDNSELLQILTFFINCALTFSFQSDVISQVQAANVLFVDNPVGTGYSYVTEDSAYTTDVSQIAADLMTLFRQFLEDLPVFKVSRSYPGFL